MVKTMNRRFEQRSVLVTGGLGGIGLATAPFHDVAGSADLAAALSATGTPAILKTCLPLILQAVTGSARRRPRYSISFSDHSQNMTVAARATAERKTFGHLS